MKIPNFMKVIMHLLFILNLVLILVAAGFVYEYVYKEIHKDSELRINEYLPVIKIDFT